MVAVKLSCPGEAKHPILIKEPVDSRGPVSNFVQIVLICLWRIRTRHHSKAPELSIQLSTGRLASVPNRTNPPSCEGKGHAPTRCAAHAQAKKPVPGMRRRNRSCRD